MKIGILTQPLKTNYGGLLQAFALQKYLKDSGHDVYTIDFECIKKPKFFGLRGLVRNIIRKYVYNNVNQPITSDDKRFLYQTRSQNTERFISENIRTTQEINTKDNLKFIQSYNFDAFVVGSDQVWRPAYNSSLSTFFLDFLCEEDNSTKRISYAASFGVDHCEEFSEQEISRYSHLLGKFDLVSVREDSAVNLCSDIFGVKAHHVIDPTLLITQNDYRQLINNDSSNLSDNNGDLMVYVLDKSDSKKLIVNRLSKKLNLTPFTVMAYSESNVFPPVTKWLKGFSESKYVITDSFHGVAFSILFNKQFIAIGNKGRGLARFLSILKLFKLENRLIHSIEDLESFDLSESIDYEPVNAILQKERKKAKLLLNSSLS